MTLPSAHSTATLRTMSVSSEPTALMSPSQFGINSGTTTLRAVNVAPAQFSSAPAQFSSVPAQFSSAPAQFSSVPAQFSSVPAQFSSVQYVNGGLDGTAIHGNVRYLVPVQRASDSYVVVNQGSQMLTPVYLQNLQGVQRLSVSSMDEVDSVQQLSINGQASSVCSPPPSPIKSPDPPEMEESSSAQEVVSIKVNNYVTSELKMDFEPEQVAKLDTRFFGELLAEVYRKNCDIHSCVSEHVSKIRGRKQLQEFDYKEEDIERLIPKGVSELTKQQIRYLLQTRMTADKTMRMLLSTFSSLKEDLVHLQDDLRRLESEKEQLERDLSFKADQAQQYDRLVETVRENNRQLQMTLKESTTAQRNLESQLMTNRGSDSSKDFRIKDLEGSKRALEQENELLRRKLEGQSSNATLQTKTQELSRHYEKMLKELREEKEREIASMRSKMVKIQTEITTDRSSGDKTLELRIKELLTTLEQRESSIRRLEEEIRRLKLVQDREKQSNSGSVTQTVITKRYENQYPILGLLSDDYQYTPPTARESKTIVIKRTGEMTKKEYSS